MSDPTRSAASTAAQAIGVDGVSHAYDRVDVLHAVSIEVEPGESVALLGPSGCGKTTLLRVIAGLERARGGRVMVGDRVVADGSTWVPPEKRRVGMVFQDWALFPQMTVAANVGYGLPRAERKGPRVADALALVGLDGLGDRMPNTLSGGQQQRVALARALAPRPGVLLLDEPFSNLDKSLRVEVRSEVHRLLSELGITSVFVTHDQEEAFVLGDRVAVMRDGRVRQLDDPRVLYNQPVDRWVAEFVGTCSTLTGTAANGVVPSAVGPIEVGAEVRGEVEVLLRPEQLALGDGDNAVVESIEYYGHDAMVFVDVGGHALRVRCGPEALGARRGERVGVSFRGPRAQAFPLTSVSSAH